MKTYSVNSIFLTVQGEGFWTGTPSIFVRLAGCNLWNGKEEDRKPAAQRMQKRLVTVHEGKLDPCPTWCDTDFLPRHKMTATDIAEAADALGKGLVKRVVFTGGEPLLQLDQELYGVFASLLNWAVQIETNGTCAPAFYPVYHTAPWITLSPKVRAKHLSPALKHAVGIHEVKLVYPLAHFGDDEEYTPEEYRDLITWTSQTMRTPLFLQPRDENNPEWNRENIRKTLEYCYAHPHWRVSAQVHKALGLE